MAGHSDSPDVDTDHIPGDAISARHERLTNSAEELPSRVDVRRARERGESGATTSRESGDEPPAMDANSMKDLAQPD